MPTSGRKSAFEQAALEESFRKALDAAPPKISLPTMDASEIASRITTVRNLGKVRSYEDGQLPTMSQREGSDSGLYYTFAHRYPKEIRALGILSFDFTSFVKDLASDEDDASLVVKYARSDLSKGLLSQQKRDVKSGGLGLDRISYSLNARIGDKILETITQDASTSMTAYEYDYNEVSLGEFPGVSFRYELTREKISWGEARKTGDFTYEIGFEVSWDVEVKDWEIGTASWGDADLA